MRLNHVDISNFRSIKSIVINFDPKCRVLVGINESGKSNILEALSLLDPDRNVKQPGMAALRQPSFSIPSHLPSESPDQPASLPERWRFVRETEDHFRAESRTCRL